MLNLKLAIELLLFYSSFYFFLKSKAELLGTQGSGNVKKSREELWGEIVKKEDEQIEQMYNGSGKK